MKRGEGMARFFVVKASRVLFWVTVVMLVLAVGLLAWYFSASGDMPMAQFNGSDSVPALAMAGESLPLEGEASPTPIPTPAEPIAHYAPVNMFAPLESELKVDNPLEAEYDEQPPVGEIHIEVIRRTPHPSGVQRVLIYHTHTYEAYLPTENDTYQATEKWRTKDSRYNILRVGAELALQLRALGFEVVHDTTEHEPPSLDTSYTRSLATLEAYRARGETFDYYIDLHRDAFTEAMRNTNTVTIGDKKLARIRLLIGKGTGQTGGGFEQKPNWQVNIKLAEKLTDSLNGMVPDLARPVLTKTGRFNQHISESAVLVEVGNNRNTLQEALDTMPYLAQAFLQVAGQP